MPIKFTLPINMRSLFVAIIFFLNFGISAQLDRDVAEVSSFNKSFGYGIGNLFNMVVDGEAYRAQVYLDYSVKKYTGLYYRIAVSSSYNSTTLGNIKEHEFIPFVLTFGVEKHFYKNRFYLAIGGDGFYSASLRYSRLSLITTDEMGVGVSGLIGGGFALREDLSIFCQYEVGVGMFRQFTNIGYVTAQTLRLKAPFIRNISLGMRHFF